MMAFFSRRMRKRSLSAFPPTPRLFTSKALSGLHSADTMSLSFAGYNKNNSKGTLVGNWVEEEVLRSATGFSRRRVPTSVYDPGAYTHVGHWLIHCCSLLIYTSQLWLQMPRNHDASRRWTAC